MVTAASFIQGWKKCPVAATTRRIVNKKPLSSRAFKSIPFFLPEKRGGGRITRLPAIGGKVPAALADKKQVDLPFEPKGAKRRGRPIYINKDHLWLKP
jgi:hypothetical protein